MSINRMTDLMQQQETERKSLAAAAYEAWLPVMQKREQMLRPFNGSYENAPHGIREDNDKLHQEYSDEWGSNGKLSILMIARHNKEREKLTERQNIVEQLKHTMHKQKDRSHGR